MSIVIKVDDNGNIVIPQNLFGKTAPNAKYTVEQVGNALIVAPLDRDDNEFDVEEWIKRFDDWIASVPNKGKIDPKATFSRDELYD